MGTDKDSKGYASWDYPDIKEYGPPLKKEDPQNETGTQNTPDMMSQMINPPMMLNMIDNINLENAKNNITSETKKRIKFPDGFSIEIDNIPDKDSINILQIKFYNYIDKLAFEKLKEIKVYYLSYYYFSFIKYDCPVLDESQKYENLAESLRTTLSDKNFKKNNKLFAEVVNGYLRDFLNILGVTLDIDEISKYEFSMDDSTKKCSPQEVSKEALIPTLSGEDNSHDERKQNEPTQSEQVGLSKAQAKSPEYVFKNVAIHQYETNIIYGEAKSFKSLLSIAIGNSDKIRKGLYILVDNSTGKDILRYTEVLGEKAILIGLEKIKEKMQEIKKRRESNAQSASFIVYNFWGNQRYSSSAEGIIKRCYKMYGVELDNPKPVNGIDVIKVIINDAIDNENIDFICIDSLNKLFGGSKKIDDEKISQLNEIIAKKNITSLCIHHTNAKGKMAGSNAIIETFENIYRLSCDTSYLKKNDDEIILLLDETDSRNAAKKSAVLKVTFGNNLNPTFEIVEELTPNAQKSIQILTSHKATNIAERIISIISGWDRDTITLVELMTKLGGDEMPKKGSIKNSLKELADMGYVQKTNGRWDVITILEPLKK